jgi:anti-anti-sigma regulatory factor
LFRLLQTEATVAFSLFGKKPTPPAPAIKRPARPAASSRPEKAAEPPPEEELASLDFTLPGEMPVAKTTARIEVKEAVTQVPPAIEQAAMLYSVEQGDPACAVLDAAIREGGLGGFEKRAWGMLFELYQSLGRQQDYEALALAYAAKFETSPPAWVVPGAEEAARPAAPVGRPGVSLAGALGAKAQEPLQQLLRLADKHASVRIDFSKVADADEAGCALLLDALKRLHKARKEFVLGGADKLAGILVRKIETGRRDLESGWLLLLELYQQLGAQEAFEDMAVNYAVTFEVSPPSWVPPKAAPAIVEEEPATEVATDHVCTLEGDLISVDPAVFAPIRNHANGEELLVDVSRLRRMDFVSAAHLMNLAGELAGAGRKLRFAKASHLLTALWEVLGLDRVAVIETRKI